MGAARGARRDRRDQGPERRAGLRPPRAHRRRQGGARPRRRVDARPRPRRHDRRDRQRRRHPPRHRPGRGAGDDRLAHRHRGTGGRFDGNLGVLAGLEVVETLEQHGVATRRPDRRRLLHRRGGQPLRARHARQPRVRRRDGRSRRRSTCGPSTTAPGSATSSTASATPARCRARRRRAPHAYVELHIEQGPVLEDEGVDDRRRRGRAGHLVDRADDRRPRRPTPARRRCGCAATPGSRPPRSPSFARAHRGRRWAAPRSPRSAASRCTPTSSTSCPTAATLTVDLRNTDEVAAAAGRAPPRRRRRRRRRRRGRHGHDAARWPASSR